MNRKLLLTNWMYQALLDTDAIAKAAKNKDAEKARLEMFVDLQDAFLKDAQLIIQDLAKEILLVAKTK